jgi:pyruvate carboxylase
MEAVREDTQSICEGAVCYTGDILDPARDKYGLKYYVKLAKELEKMGAHMLCIKDMAGLIRPYAATKLVKALKDEIGIPFTSTPTIPAASTPARFSAPPTPAWTWWTPPSPA